MFNMKPRIAVTLGRKEKNPSDQEYQDAVSKAGGVPVVVRPGDSPDAEEFDGLLLSGGEDVDPEFYHEKKEPYCDDPDRERDALELSLLRRFLASGKPVLAICRGIQLLNAGLGGTLYQDLEVQRANPLLPAHRSQEHLSREGKRAQRHRVKIEAGSILHRFFGDETEVNSRHHQAIKAISPELKITAVSDDGIIEGVELAARPWVVGVQWHPESYEVHAAFAPLFEGFVSKCSEKLPHAATSRRAPSRIHDDPAHRAGAEAPS